VRANICSCANYQHFLDCGPFDRTCKLSGLRDFGLDYPANRHCVDALFDYPVDSLEANVNSREHWSFSRVASYLDCSLQISIFVKRCNSEREEFTPRIGAVNEIRHLHAVRMGWRVPRENGFCFKATSDKRYSADDVCRDGAAHLVGAVVNDGYFDPLFLEHFLAVASPAIGRRGRFPHIREGRQEFSAIRKIFDKLESGNVSRKGCMCEHRKLTQMSPRLWRDWVRARNLPRPGALRLWRKSPPLPGAPCKFYHNSELPCPDARRDRKTFSAT
jgi:hypothetical protein